MRDSQQDCEAWEIWWRRFCHFPYPLFLFQTGLASLSAIPPPPLPCPGDTRLCTYQCQARGRGGGGGVRHRVGILTFSKKKFQNPHPRAKKVVKISRNKWIASLLLLSIKLKDHMHDIWSKSAPWEFTSQSNSRGFPDNPLPPPPPRVWHW